MTSTATLVKVRQRADALGSGGTSTIDDPSSGALEAFSSGRSAGFVPVAPRQIPASGVIIYPPKENGQNKPLRCLWTKVAYPGMVGLGFLAFEADQFDLPEAASSTSSLDQPQALRSSSEKKLPKRLSLADARAMAIQVFEAADEAIQRERDAEARFLASLWQDEDQ